MKHASRLVPAVMLAWTCAAMAADFEPVPISECKAGFTSDPRNWQGTATFIVGVDNWPHLGDAWPRQGGTRWPGWSYGQIVVPGASGKTQAGPADYLTQSYRHDLDGGKQFTFTISRASPALRVDTDATQVEFFHDLKEQMQDAKGGKTFGPAFVAFATAAGPVVRKLDASIDLSAMSEPWLLFWFGKDAPLRPNRNDWGWSEHWHVHDIYNRVPYTSDKPWLIVLSAKPQSVEKKLNGTVVTFPAAAGTMLAAPFFGHRFSAVEETAPWADGNVADAARRAQFLTTHLLAWPASAEEQFSVDESADHITLRTTFKFEPIATAWPIKPVAVAPISPMLATARAAGMPVSILAAGREANVIDLAMPTPAGPLTGVEGAESYDLVFTGLIKYIWQAPAPPSPAAENEIAGFARKRLADEVGKMIQAGILRPLRMVSGEMNPQYYWENPADTVLALSETVPHLSADLQARTKAYLKTYIDKFNPLKVGKVDGEVGTPREYSPWPKTDKWSKPSNTVPVGNIYAAWLYARISGDAAFAKSAAQPASLIFGYFERQSDWLQFGPIDRVSWQMDYPSDELNARLNGIIGYARLMRQVGQEAEVRKAEYLFAKVVAQRLAGANILRYMYESKQVEWPYNGWNSSIDVAPKYADDPAVRLLHATSRIDKFGPMLHTFSQQDDRGWIPAMVPFLNLSPEVARLLNERMGNYCTAYLDSADYSWADWWVTAGAQQYGGENDYNPPHIAAPGFLAKAWIAQEPSEKLRMRIDIPICRVGDLDYLRKLSALLGRTGPTLWQPIAAP